MLESNQLFILRALTDLHPGTGRSDFHSIDHKVQRDHRGYPFINKAAVKGAIREFVESPSGEEEVIQAIFGGNHGRVRSLRNLLERIQKGHADSEALNEVIELVKTHEIESKGKPKAGLFSFDDARMLFLPVRTDKFPFVMVTCDRILEDFMRHLKYFNLSKEEDNLYKEINLLSTQTGYLMGWEGMAEKEDVILEDTTLKVRTKAVKDDDYPLLRDILDGELRIAVLEHNDFKELCGDEFLPIRTRNALDNGISKQLWFEQVIPPEAMFYFIIGYPNDMDEEKKYLDGIIHDKVMNFGASASVGYGKCHCRSIQVNQNKK